MFEHSGSRISYVIKYTKSKNISAIKSDAKKLKKTPLLENEYSVYLCKGFSIQEWFQVAFPLSVCVCVM